MSVERSSAAGAVVVIGNFDGVHRGHRAVLDQARKIADERGLACVVLTFDPHPGEVLGRGAPSMLTTMDRRIELLQRAGADIVKVEPFTMDLAAWSPERFARELLVDQLRAKAVVVGENFRFGAKRAGDFDTLRALGSELGFEAVAAEVAGDARGRFSSTRVREDIAKGDVDAAAAVLSRWHSVSGVVEKGDQIGRTLGFPTANLGGVRELLPAYGIYAVVVDDITGDALSGPSGKALSAGALSIGVRPTIAGATALRVETYLFLNEPRDLYGRRLRYHLVARLRDEQKFETLDALKAQIARDVEAAHALTDALAPPGATYA